MKDFYGTKTQPEYYETEKSGKLTHTYGSGAVITDSIHLEPGTYIMTAKIGSDTSVGNALSTGIYQARIQNSSTIYVDGSHTGDGAYAMGFSVTGIVKLDTAQNVFALGQTGSQTSVGGGLNVKLRIVKIN